MTKPIHIACTKKLNDVLKKDAQEKSIFIEDAEIIETSSALNKSIIPYLNNRDYTYVFTSSKAVKYFVEYNKNIIHKITNNCFALSGATAESLSTTSVCIVGTANDASALAEKIIHHQHKKLVHFTAIDHRKELYETLSKSNIKCETYIVYAKKNVPKIFKATDAVLFFSPSQVDTFLSCNTLSLATPVFCIGCTTAKHAETKKFSNIIISNEPSQDAMLEKVYQYFKIQQ